MTSTRHSRSRAVPAVPALESPKVAPVYADCLERTRTSLHARLADAPAGDLLREYFARGKMLRASLVFAAAAAVGGDPDDVVIAAEAIELLHGASLFHDDIIDRASERRGLTSLHLRLGVGPALVLGDDLLLRAFAVLAEARAAHPPARVLEATELLNELARECCRGQLEELCSARWISEEKYLEIVRGKTAAPFVAAGVLGAILGGGTSAHVARIRIYAGMIGVAFQIGDDLLDLVGEAGLIGKPTGNSLAQGRPMLPLIYLGRIGSEAALAEFARLTESDRPRHELVALLEREGILERVRRVQQEHVEAALAALENLPSADGADALRALAARATAPFASGGPVHVHTPASA
jgi:geranylgeranyl pyrophosphate synthase